MFNLLTSLTHHQAWADATLLTAVQAHPDSLHDEQMLKTLHHIVRTQRVLPLPLPRPAIRQGKGIPAPRKFRPTSPALPRHPRRAAGLRHQPDRKRPRAEIRAARPEIPAHHRRRTHPDRHAQPEPSRTVPHPPPRKRRQAAHPRLHLWAKDRPAPSWPQPTQSSLVASTSPSPETGQISLPVALQVASQHRRLRVASGPRPGRRSINCQPHASQLRRIRIVSRLKVPSCASPELIPESSSIVAKAVVRTNITCKHTNLLRLSFAKGWRTSDGLT